MAKTKISVLISDATKRKLERYVQARGVKQSHVVEQALLHHLQALRELPPDVVIPPRLTVTAGSFAEVATVLKKPRRPTRALRDLVAGKRVTTEP